MTGFSQSRSARSFIGGAIETVASPLRNTFIDGCRSPVTPRRIRRPSTQDDSSNRSPNRPQGLYVNTEQARYGAYSSSTYLTTPHTFSITSPTKKESTYASRNHSDDDVSSSTTLVSPSNTHHFLPLTPNFMPSASSGKLGTFSAINVILGKTVGVGIYSIPSSIFESVGSTTTSQPPNGTSPTSSQAPAPNHMTTQLHSSKSSTHSEATAQPTRSSLKSGTRSQQAGALMRVGSSTSPLTRRRLGGVSLDAIPDHHLSTAQRNFSNLFAGSSTQPYDYATALLKILYSFRGYSTANQVLSEVRNPIPTLKLAAPVALSLVSLGYILANISYFLVVSKDDFRSSGVVIAGHFFKNIFGEVIGENVLPIFIIISAFGNIAATSFAQARVNQELGKDGLLPFSSWFAKKNQWDSPTPGLFLHWLISVLVIVVPPPGEIYNFLVDIGGYPVSVISVAISLGLLYLQSNPEENWQSPFRAKKIYTIIFAASNCLLLVLPWVKPRTERGDGRFAYYAYPVTALGILGSGVVYWCWWAKIKPRLFGGESWLKAGREERRGHKREMSDEGFPMMRFEETYGSDDGRPVDEDEDDEDHGLLRQGPRPEEGDEGMRKRAPCGCPIDHGNERKESRRGSRA
ncbi:related to high affinity methionine permease [Phialocephala subalpina]|uniref:Related to high affinity methionine permease n=1 Tax=Phialocephala subalpina TaxID=576137 RepID=A0A1L7WFW3_9HELO|nr:related to high affinity methionine permease [Phialocephala subalpina]